MRTLYKGPLAVGVTRCVSTPARLCDPKTGSADGAPTLRRAHPPR